jgi:peptidoglycan/LPS O-acetylase OafA/YrhL
MAVSAQPVVVAPETTARHASKHQHVRALDGLRGLAILLVLMRHVGEDAPAQRVGGVLHAALQSGWLGVDVFFVLSGFLITGILLDSRGPGYFRNFYTRRALRIFPAYYMFLAISPVGAWWYWTYLSNVMIARHGWPTGTWDMGHLWSLSVEEQFYLVWPAIIAWTPRRRLPVLCLTVILSAIALRAMLLHQGAALSAYVLTPARADTLVLGALLAIALRDVQMRETVRRQTSLIGVLALGALSVLFVTHQLDHRLSFGGLVLGSVAATLATAACIVRISDGGRIRRIFEWAPLVSFGSYSYAIYLVQLPLRGGLDYWWGARLATMPPLVATAVEGVLLTGASWCVAWVSWRLLEQPILSLKRLAPMPRYTD